MTIVPAEIAMCVLGIVVIIALFLFFVVWYVASPYESIDKKFTSDVDESVLADKPLTIGPGYTRNPALNSSK